MRKYLIPDIIVATSLVLAPLIVGGATGYNYAADKPKYDQPYTLIVDKLISDKTIHNCREDSNCMDVMTWQDMDKAKSLGVRFSK